MTSTVRITASPQSDKSLGTFRNSEFPNELVSDLDSVEHLDTCWDIMKHGCSKSSTKPCLGILRKKEGTGEEEKTLSEEFYHWITYSEVALMAIIFSKGVEELNLCHPYEFENHGILRLFGVFFKNRPEWIISDQACGIAGITLVSIYSTLGVDALVAIFNETKLSTVCVSHKELLTIIELLKSNRDAIHIKDIILLPDSTCCNCVKMVSDSTRYQENKDNVENSDVAVPSTAKPSCCDHALRRLIDQKYLIQRTFDSGEHNNENFSLDVDKTISVHTWESVLSRGMRCFAKQPSWENAIVKSSRTTMNIICYTSGTTGNPKGVCLTHSSFISAICGAIRGPFSLSWVSIGPVGSVKLLEDCHLSYLPLAHVYERNIVYLALFCGARIGFSSGDIKNIMQEVCALKPTVFVSVPRLYERLYGMIEVGIQKKPLWMRAIIHCAMKSKEVAKQIDTRHLSSRIWDKMLLSPLRDLLGGRIRYLVVAGAALQPAIAERLSLYFSVPFVEAYGLTEVGGPAFVSHSFVLQAGCLGSPLPSCEFKIVTVESLSYSVTSPTPKGELLLRGPSLMTGYFLKSDATKEVLTPDGWFRTGDIVELDSSTTSFRIRIIDRKSQLFKLANGEYICPERLEHIYEKVQLIDYVYIPALPSSNYIVAIVVLNLTDHDKLRSSLGADIKEVFDTNGHIREDVDLNRTKVKDHILKIMRSMAEESKLCGFEKVKHIWITKDPFTVENNQLTQTLKLKRWILKEVYSSQIKQMYSDS